ncbi:TIGR03751 family conjugal transfer lipoprotein [Pseudomonas chlororaphis]|uniref:TIGR03751 family conjugal transfer lipoprotein n=1 Tax=Pseudomonas chlororaphis TaxID=587753 RepID=UPI0013201747|nr:TIGR03751 family conjugal transfer lipoprotein [Pseudomonas chlororaphis]QHC91390.1 conjugal transfer protein [Pseudomonas chlororaphis]
MPLPLSTKLGPKVCFSLIIAVLLPSLPGCSTSKDEMLPHGDNTMLDVWDQGTTGSIGSAGSRQLLDARLALRRPLDLDPGKSLEANSTFTRTSQNEIYSQFKRLPNPDLVMYVFPHLAGSDPSPVPGYTTVFPLYQRVQYAMPGERTEDY